MTFISSNESECLKDALLSACELLASKYPNMDPVVTYHQLLTKVARERMVQSHD